MTNNSQVSSAGRDRRADAASMGIEGYYGYTSVIKDLSSIIPGGPLTLRVSGFPYSASASLTLGADSRPYGTARTRLAT